MSKKQNKPITANYIAAAKLLDALTSPDHDGPLFVKEAKALATKLRKGASTKDLATEITHPDHTEALKKIGIDKLEAATDRVTTAAKKTVGNILQNAGQKLAQAGQKITKKP